MSKDKVTYKLTYFDTEGRAEAIRLLFAAADKNFVDERITKEQWQKLKPETPQGSIPILVVNGEDVICQSNAIFRYLAREFGLYGSTNLEIARVDVALETMRELSDAGIAAMTEADTEKKEELMNTFKTETVPTKLGHLQNLIKKTGGFIAGSSPTAADFMIYAYIELLNLTGALDNFDKLKSHRERVEKLTRITKYLKKKNEKK